MAKHERWELQSKQAAPMNVKIALTKQRIREWVDEYGEDGVYVSFSGGKDSTVLLHIVRELFPNIPAVFCNTGLEYPEIVKFVKTFDNVEIIRPKLSFFKVCEKYGFPLISKEVSECVAGARKYLDYVLTKMQDESASLTDRQTDKSGIIRNSVSFAEWENSIHVRSRETIRDRQIRQIVKYAASSGIHGGVKSDSSENSPDYLQMTGRFTKNFIEEVISMNDGKKCGGGAMPHGDSEQSTESSLLKTLLMQDFETVIDNLRIQRLMGINTLTGKVTMENIPSKEEQHLRDRSMFSCERYQFFLDAPFEISNQCCTVMKKEPMHRYQKETGRNPMTAEMASESRLRTQVWLNNGCNMFDLKNPKSTPMAFWTEQDVLLYIYENHIPIAPPYGEIVKENEVDGQLDFADLEIFDLGRPILKTTGCDRTG